MGLQENGNKYQRMDGHGNGEGIALSNTQDQEQEVAFIKNGGSKKYVTACAIFASLNSVLLGYACPNHSADVGVMSGAIIFMKEDLKISEVQHEVLVGILSIISLLGSLAGGKTSDVLGRKWTIALAAIVFQSGAAIMALAPSFTVWIWQRKIGKRGRGTKMTECLEEKGSR